MARRVNSKFLVILIVVGLGCAIGALFAPRIVEKFKSRGDAVKLIAEGDELLAKGENEPAKEKFLHATRADPNNTQAWLRLGDAFAKLTPDDPAYLQAAESSWNRALAIDPRFVPAMTRLIDSYSDFLDFAPRADLFAKVRELTDKQLTVEPDNKEAATRRVVVTIRQWLVTQTASSEDISKTLQEIPELMRKDPANPALPFWYGQAKIRQARDLISKGQPSLAETSFKDLVGMMDIACEQQPENGPMHFNAFRVYSQLDKVDPRTRDNPADDRYKMRAAKAIAVAQSKSTDKDELYFDTQIMAAEWCRQQNKPEEAEKIIRAMYETHKQDQRARLAMARLLKLKPEGRAEAAAILAEPLPPDKGATGFKALVRRELEAQTLHELVLMRLGDYAAANAAKDAEKRKAAEAGIEEGLDKLRRLTSAKALRVMDLEGRYHLIRGDNVAAVKALEDAVAQMTTTADYDVMYLLAQSYLTTSQPGQARGLLEKIVKDVPGWAQPRLRLTEMLLQEGDGENARRHIAELKKQPSQTEEMKKEIAKLEQTVTLLSKGAAAESDFPNLPEKTREERLRKAQFALLLEKPDEAVRLLKLVLAENTTDGPSARDVVRGLVAIYETRNQMDRAIEVVEGALKQYPEDPVLRLLKLGLSNASPAEIYNLRRELANKLEDEFQRELALYDVERGPGGDPTKALPHLERAYEIKSNDRRVLDQLYGIYVQRRDWAKAEVYLNKLVEINADECNGLLYRQRFAMAKGDFQAAEDIGVQLVNQYKEFAASWLALAQAQQALGKFEEALRSYREVRVRQPKHYEALRGLVDCAYQCNRPEEAEIALNEGHKLFPKDTVFREMRLNHMVNFGNPAQAIADREKLLKENLDEPGYYLALAGTQFHAAQYVAANPKAGLSTTAEYLNNAFQTLRAGAQKFPDDGRFYAQMAEMHQYAGRLDVGEQTLRAYAKREAVKDKPGPYLLLADYYTRVGRTDLTESFLIDALNKAEGDEKRNILLRLSGVQTQRKNYAQALASLTTVGKTDDPRVTRQRIEILIAQGDLAAALTEINAALRVRESADLLNLKASILIDTGKVEEALQVLAAAQRLEPRSEVSRYLIALAKAKLPQPDVEGGIKDLIEIRNRNPRNMQVRLLLAELYSNTGRGKVAISELVDALEKVPLNKDIRSMLVRLHRSQRPPNFDAAMELINKALVDPVLRNDPVWFREKAIIHMAKKEYLPALEAMDKAIALAPDKLEYHRERLDMILQFNDYDAVIRESDKLLAAGHDTWWLRHQRMLSFAKLRDQSKWPQAVVECDAGLALCDKVGDISTAEFMLRGLAGAVKPDGYDQAIKRVTARVAGGDPDNRWNLLLVALHRGKADYATAQRLVEVLLANPANNSPDRRVPVLRAAADVYQNAKPPDYEKTKKMYVELLTHTPEDLAALNNLAYLYLESKRPDEAQKAKVYSGRAYQISRLSGSPNDLVFDTHGWVLTMCGPDDAAAGLKILQDVCNRRPEFVEGLYHLGESYMRQERPQFPFAQEALQKGLGLIAEQEKSAEATGDKVDPTTLALKDKIQDALARAINKTPPK